MNKKALFHPKRDGKRFAFRGTTRIAFPAGKDPSFPLNARPRSALWFEPKPPG